MRIAILGSGGVGGYFGGRLAASGTDVVFIARGEHLRALRAGGLRILSPTGDVHLPHVNASDDPASVGAVDVVFFTVKLYDSQSALALLPPMLGRDTVVIPFQNGVESVAMLSRAVGDARVAGGTAYVSAVISEPGCIRHTAMGTLVFGEVNGTRTARLERLLEACRPAGFHATLSEHIQTDIWAKFVRLTVLSGLTAVTRSPVGVIRDDADLVAMWDTALREGLAVARAHGIEVPGAIDEATKTLTALPAQTKSSMLEDLERGRPIELPWLSGAVVRLGRDAGVDTPTHRFIATVLKPHVNGRTVRV